MRIFINNIDSYVGKALCADLRSAYGHDNKLFGTLSGGTKDDATLLLESLGVKRVVSRADQEQHLRDVLSCSLIVYDLHSAKVEEVEMVIKHLKVAKLEHETTFVLISSVGTWARTRKVYVPVEGEEDEEPPEDEEGAESKVKKRPKALTDAELDKRVPFDACQAWKYLETLALSLVPHKKPKEAPEKLRTHVIAAGVLYGNGEETFNELFKAAWLTQATHEIIYPGENFIPCVHVRDVARLVKVAAMDATVGRYLIAVDKAKLTQSQIVHGIVNQIANKTDIPVVPEGDAKSEFKDIMTMDLIMEPSEPMRKPSFQWWCRDGLVANLEKVADEFTKWRNLRPIKIIIQGPPGSGSERYGDLVAERYLHEDPPHFTFEGILQDAMAKGTESAARLRAKVEKLAAKPGSKLPLKTRTKLVRARLLSNVCRYRGYVLRGYPESFQEAEALFTEIPKEEGEEEPEAAEGEEEEEEEDEEEAPPPPAEDEDEEEEEGKPKRRLNAKIAPEFVVALRSEPDFCKARIFNGLAKGASSEEEFLIKTAEYNKANLSQDGSPGTSDFFAEVAANRVLHLDVDSVSEDVAFQAIRVYMEAKGQFFNYLHTEEERVRERQEQIERQQHIEDAKAEEERQAQEAAEAALRQQACDEEAKRRQAIADSEASLLETEALPLRQYLMNQVVPTLSEGLAEVCKEQPDDPIEYLAQYLFAHAQDINDGAGGN